MNKGLIMEIKDDYAIVMCDNGTMDKILIKPGMSVGQKIFYFEDDIVKVSASPVKKNYRINTFIKSFGSIAALFLIIFTVFQNVMFDKAYAVVSIDINPSIEITADSKKNIIKVEGKNLDGQDIDFQKIKGLNIDEGIKKIKDILVEKDYLSANKDILVAVGFPNNDCDTKYAESVQEIVVSTFDNENIACVTVDKKEDIKEANQKGLSLGRYEAYKVADDNVKQNIKTAPVKELTAQIKDQDNVVYWDSSKDELNSSESAPVVKDEKPVISQTDESKNNTTTGSSKTEVNNESGKQQSKLPSGSNDNSSSSSTGSNQGNNNNTSSSSNAPQEIELQPETPPQDADKKEEVVTPPQEQTKPANPGTGTGSTNVGKDENGTGSDNSEIDVPKAETKN